MGENVSYRGSWFVPSSIQPLFLSQLPPSADLAVAVFLTFSGVASVLGNGVVLLVYSRKRKKLRPPELMTINLAICDFGFSLLGAPFFIISSLCHAWVFGETGCLWYGIQGFVFGIGSLLTTCLISLDRCLKICCLRYGQWVERRHVYLSIALLWVYTLFWASLPAFGFGSYGAEPYGTSCTINWWKIRSSLNDRIYIFLILILCFGFPTLTIVISYVAILLTVYRSNRTIASIPSSSVTHARRDLRLAKMAAVMCATFLLAWMPYATVSLISALVLRDNLEAETLQNAMDESSAMTLTSPRTAKIPDIPTLLHWTATESYRQIYSNQNKNEGNAANMNLTSDLNDTTFSFTLGKEADLMTRSSHSFSCLPPVATLIPAMLAKSHCMINPFIYQIMNREFRNDIYVMVLGQKKAMRRKESLCERSISVFYCQSGRRTNPTFLSVRSKHRNLTKQKDGGCSSGVTTDASVEDILVVADTLDFTSVYTVQSEKTVIN